MRQYKLRAECMGDVFLLMDIIGRHSHAALFSFKVETIRLDGEHRIPDVVLEFTSCLTLSQVRALIKTIDDSHVMAETVQPVSKYTGERVSE